MFGSLSVSMPRQGFTLMGWDILVASLVVNLLGLALPLSLLHIYDRVIPHQALGTLTLLALGVFAALVLEFFMRVARASISAWFGAQYEHATATEGFERLVRSDLRHGEREQAGVTLDRFNAIELIREFYSNEAAFLFSDAPFLFIYVAILFYLAPVLGVITCVAVVASILVTHFIGVVVRDALARRSDLDDRRFNFIIEILKSIEHVKSFGIEAFMERRYERLMASSAEAGRDLAFYSNVSTNIGVSLAQLTTTIIAAFGALLVVENAMSVGTLAACILLSGRVVQPITRLQGLWTRLQTIEIAQQKISGLLAIPRSTLRGNKDVGVIEQIRLENVSIKADDESQPILKNISLDLHVGETVAITGANGSGKSTLIWTLACALTPNSGNFYINGRSIDDLSLKSISSQIAVLPQRSTMLPGTLLENMTAYDVVNNLNDAIEMASTLGLDNFFSVRPEGLTMQVGEQGAAGLPSSVTERIAIVRALVGKPKVILFDEANLSLDQHTDVQLRQLLDTMRKDCILVMVTHRPSYLAMADRRYRLEDGYLESEDAVEGIMG